MKKIKLSGFQECINLYPMYSLKENKNKPIIAHPTPGLKQIFRRSEEGIARALYTDSRENLIAVIDDEVWHIFPHGEGKIIGHINNGINPVKIADNGITLIIVDGTVNGMWYATLPSQPQSDYGNLVQWVDTSNKETLSELNPKKQNLDTFPGSNTIAIIDQFFLFVQPNSKNFYLSPKDFTNQYDTPFDKTCIASKKTYPDPLSGVAVVNQYIWLLGEQTTEIWFNTGDANFPFQRISGISLSPGCTSPYSIATDNDSVFWLGGARQGGCSVYMGTGEVTQEISTSAISSEFSSYNCDIMKNAIGSIYNQYGHTFYVLTFPGNGKTWVYDISTELWHSRSSMDNDGNYNGRYRPAFFANVYNTTYALDYEKSNLYLVSKDYHSDNGINIQRTGIFYNISSGGKRIIHRELNLNFSESIGNVNLILKNSDNRGHTFSNGIKINLVTQKISWIKCHHLGISRDKVYKISWEDNDENYITEFLDGYVMVDITNF